MKGEFHLSVGTQLNMYVLPYFPRNHVLCTTVPWSHKVGFHFMCCQHTPRCLAAWLAHTTSASLKNAFFLHDVCSSATLLRILKQLCTP